jgi:hypothetical protein
MLNLTRSRESWFESTVRSHSSWVEKSPPVISRETRAEAQFWAFLRSRRLSVSADIARSGLSGPFDPRVSVWPFWDKPVAHDDAAKICLCRLDCCLCKVEDARMQQTFEDCRAADPELEVHACNLG